MIDIMLNAEGDVDVSPLGDISLTNIVMQAVLIRLRWIYNEWRLGPQYGFPWLEDVFVKNPNIVKIKSLIRSEIVQVDGVTDANVYDVIYEPSKRAVTFYFSITVNEEVYREEVTLYG